MQIVIAPNPVLTAPCSRIERDDKFTLQTLKDMRQYIMNPANHAAGLALPQVGISKRGFVCRLGNLYEIVVNPQISKYSKQTKEAIEGCLSLPDTPVTVFRSIWVEVQYQYIAGNGCLKTTKKMLAGMDARVFQHEFDHLNGKLITDYLEVA